ncbi:unnamed protein product [Ectocarpus fasciculatus]
MVLIPTVVSLVAGAWMGAGSADGQFVQLGHFRAALWALTLTRASAYLIHPVRAWLTALHDSVRDDRYLVGMRLQDHSDKAQQADASPDSESAGYVARARAMAATPGNTAVAPAAAAAAAAAADVR